jgi:hypothetical protein
VREFIKRGSPIVKQKAAVDAAAEAGFPCREQKTTGDEYTRGRIQINWKSKRKGSLQVRSQNRYASVETGCHVSGPPLK